jgi:hypothetical protein
MDAAFGTSPFDRLALDVPGAQVRLRPHAEDDRVQVRGFVPGADLDTARDIFDRKGISTQQSGDQLHVYGEALSTTVDDWRWRQDHHPAVHLDLFLPPTLNVTAQTPGGAIDASGLAGTIDLRVMGGSATAERLEGPLDVRGSGGRLTVQESSGPSLDLQWSAGPVRLQQIESDGTTLRARSAPTTLRDHRGPVTLSVHGASLEINGVAGPCEARVRGGALTYSGAPSGETTLAAVGGPLRTQLPRTHAAEVVLTGSQVDLDDAFPFTGEQTARRIEGTLNGGGPRLRLRAVRGIATCRPQQAGGD